MLQIDCHKLYLRFICRSFNSFTLNFLSLLISIIFFLPSSLLYLLDHSLYLSFLFFSLHVSISWCKCTRSVNKNISLLVASDFQALTLEIKWVWKLYSIVVISKWARKLKFNQPISKYVQLCHDLWVSQSMVYNHLKHCVSDMASLMTLQPWLNQKQCVKDPRIWNHNRFAGLTKHNLRYMIVSMILLQVDKRP